ncbi:MAG: potassium channel family protein [Pseudobdellovibrionaceae bacterium]
MVKNKISKIKNEIILFLISKPMTVVFVFIVTTWLVADLIVYEFEKPAQGANITSYPDALWWGIVTMLTVGYGDRYPITTEGRIGASFVMFAGIICTGIFTAKISSLFFEKALRDRRGSVDTDSLKSHFIICGWKNEMQTLLNHIIDNNSNIKAKDIIVVANVTDAMIGGLLEFPHLKSIRFIQGDFFAADVLKRAAPEKAIKIMILADATPNALGVIPTMSEADSRTVMTAMTLNNIAKGVPVVAEVLDSDMSQYLKLAHVQEIIYSREYSRFLLAMASMGTGVANIFHDLLNPMNKNGIQTLNIPDVFFNKSYADLKKYYLENHPNMILIGILENSGNSHKAKELALKKAQKTPNISELVTNLTNVKNIKFNNPIFNPKDDHLILETTMAIVIVVQPVQPGATA